MSADESALQALRMMRDHDISGVAIVDSGGSLLGHFSVSELRSIMVEHLGALALPVLEFLQVSDLMDDRMGARARACHSCCLSCCRVACDCWTVPCCSSALHLLLSSKHTRLLACQALHIHVRECCTHCIAPYLTPVLSAEDGKQVPTCTSSTAELLGFVRDAKASRATRDFDSEPQAAHLGTDATFDVRPTPWFTACLLPDFVCVGQANLPEREDAISSSSLALWSPRARSR
jgi:CBS domain-containing protein